MRTTITDMGPLLLARLLGLNDTQEGILNIAFSWPMTKACCYWILKICALCWSIWKSGAKSFQPNMAISHGLNRRDQRDLLVLEQQGSGAFLWRDCA